MKIELLVAELEAKAPTSPFQITAAIASGNETIWRATAPTMYGSGLWYDTKSVDRVEIEL